MASRTTYQLDVLLGASTSSSFQGNLNRAAAGIESLGNTAKLVAAGITAVFAAVNITQAIESAVETYTGFEQEMSTVSAIAQATRSEYELMEQASLAAGRSTIYTAQEAASALEYMSLAGWDVNTSIKAQVPILRLAAATQKELGTTSDLVTDSMSALGLEADELDIYLDRLIAGNNNANTTAEQLMESLVKAGGASRTLGADLDDTITALGILANNGVKGEEAGTALNSIFTRIATNSAALKELDHIGVSIFDENGSFIGLEESLTAINEAMADFTAEQKTQSLGEIAGTNRYSQFAYLLNAVEENVKTGTTNWEKLEREIVNSGGDLLNMYDITTDTLLNAQATLNSAKEDMQIRIVDVFSDDAKDFTLWLAEKLPEATDSIVEFAEVHRGDFADALEMAGELIEGAWGAGVKAMTWLTGHKGAITGTLTAIGTSLAAAKIVDTGKSLIGVVSSLASMGPAGWAVGALGITAGALVGVTKALEEADERAAALDLAEHFGNIGLSLEEIDTLARQIIGKGTIGSVTEFLNSVDESYDSLGRISDVLKDLQKESWKINVGFNMTTDDYEEYASQLESYISGVEDYAANKGYEVHLATSLLFGTGSLEDKESGRFYEQIQRQLEEYGNELQIFLYGEGEEVGGALADGIIDSLEDIKIQEILTKMNDVTSTITEAESKAKFDALTLQYNGADLDSESILKVLEDLEQYEIEVREGARQAYESAMTSNYARLELDKDYTKEDFNKNKEEAWVAYLKKAEEAETNSATYALETLEKSYPELNAYMKQLESIPQQVIDKWTNPENEYLMSRLKSSPEEAWGSITEEIFQELRENFENIPRGLKEYTDAMTPTMEALEEEALRIQSTGESLNAETVAALSQWQAIKGIAYLDGDALLNELSDLMSPGGQMYNFLEEKLSEKEMSAWLPYVGGDSINIVGDNSKTIEESITQQAQDIYDQTESALENTYKKGFNIEASLDIMLNPTYKGLETELDTMRLPYSSVIDNLSKSKVQKYSNVEIASNAQGGIYDHPILTTFAEEGPEAALPLDGSDRAKSLWVQAGEMLGMFQGKTKDLELLESINTTGNTVSASNFGDIKIEFNPVITIQGNADKREVREAVSIGINELREMIDDIVKERERTAF